MYNYDKSPIWNPDRLTYATKVAIVDSEVYRMTFLVV